MIDLNEHKWTTPDSYDGFNPVGDIILAVQTRDSSILEQSNYQAIFTHLLEFSKQFDEPQYLTGKSLTLATNDWGDERSEYPWVYDFRASHWACGWIETLLVRDDAPQKLLDEVEGILSALADYPVFDESHYIKLQWDESEKWWQQLKLDERVNLCRDMGCSIFQARHDWQPTDGSNPMSEFYDFLN